MESDPCFEDASAPARGLPAGAPLTGGIRVPGSKSIAQRALIAAALVRGESRLHGREDDFAGEDVRATIAWLRDLGVAVEAGAPGAATTAELVVCGRGPGLSRRAGQALCAGESGTLARLGTAVLALCGAPGEEFTLAAEGSLRERSHAALWDALGPRVLERGWPTVLRAAPVDGSLLLRHPASSQEVSGLLLALAASSGRRVLRVEGAIPSRPYVELTGAVLRGFDVRVHSHLEGEVEQFEVFGVPRAARIEIEPDASLAAVALAAGCLTGGSVCAVGLTPASAQGDVRIAEHLAAFGCQTRWTAEGLCASGAPTRGAALDLSGEPDLAPVLAVVAAAAGDLGHASRLGGLGTLPGKESSRIEVLVEGLRACGWSVGGGADYLELAPTGPGDRSARGAGPGPDEAVDLDPVLLDPVLLDPRGDHRMAFAFALAGLLRPGVRVAQPGCVAKSWPGFWEELGALAARD